MKNINNLKTKNYIRIHSSRVDFMSDKLLEKYFEELREHINNEDYIRELEETIEEIDKETFKSLVKRHF